MGRPIHSLWYAVQIMTFNNGKVGTCRLIHTNNSLQHLPKMWKMYRNQNFICKMGVNI